MNHPQPREQFLLNDAAGAHPEARDHAGQQLAPGGAVLADQDVQPEYPRRALFC
jgi:hypothetical protein